MKKKELLFKSNNIYFKNKKKISYNRITLEIVIAFLLLSLFLPITEENIVKTETRDNEIPKPSADIPDPIFPPDGSVIGDDTPNFEWTSVSGADLYQIQGSRYADFHILLGDETTSDTHFQVPDTSPLPDGIIYWRVRARIGGIWGNYPNPPWSFALDSTPPNPPDLISPPNGIILGDTTPTFDWAPINDPTGEWQYQIQVDDSISFSSPEIDAITNTVIDPDPTEYTVPPEDALTEGLYYWRVKGRDGMGWWGDYGDPWELSIVDSVPSKPTNQLPLDNEMINDATPYFEWSGEFGVEGYVLQVVRDDISVIEFQVTLPNPNNYYIRSTPMNDRTYRWRVYAYNPLGDSPWSDFTYFTIDTVGPAPPGLISPSDEETISDSTPSLVWENIGEDEYHFQIAEDPEFTSIIIDDFSSSPNYDITTWLLDNVYYWHVCAKDIVGNWGGWSDTFEFTIDTTGPAPPSLTSPLNNTAINDNTPSLVWDDIMEDEYQVQIAEDSGFTTIIVDDFSSTPNYNTIMSLSEITYYWHIRAKDNVDNWGDWSEYFKFTIDMTAPDPPLLLSPSSEHLTNDNTPYLDWDSVLDAEEYKLQVDDSPTFSSLNIDIVTQQTDYDISVPLADSAYYWRVQSIDEAGNGGDWSESWNFTIDTIGPTPPAIISPSNDDIIKNDTVLLNWSDIIDADGYHLEIYDYDPNSPLLGSLLIEIYTKSSSYKTPTLSDDTYYWHICANDTLNNWGDWCDYYSFTIDTSLPLIGDDGGNDDGQEKSKTELLNIPLITIAITSVVGISGIVLFLSKKRKRSL